MELKFRRRDSDPWEEYDGAAALFVLVGLIVFGVFIASLLGRLF